MRRASLVLFSAWLAGCTAPHTAATKSALPVAPVHAATADSTRQLPIDLTQLDVWIGGSRRDLTRGSYLLAFISASCAACEEHVAELNTLAATPGVPEVVGLLLGDEQTLEYLIARASPQFPLAVVEPELFFKCIGEVPPRFIHVRENRQVRTWDGHPPSCADFGITVPPRPDEFPAAQLVLPGA